MINLVDLLWKGDLSHDRVSRKNPDYLNVSDLSSLCPRKHYLINRQENKSISGEYINSNIHVAFYLGRAAEIYIRERFVNAYGIDKILGFWNLRGRKPTNEKLVIKNYNNEDLEEHEWMEFRLGTKDDTLEDYNEIEAYNDQYKIKGHIDWAYLDTNGKITITDFKSTSKKEFDKLNETEKAPYNYISQIVSYKMMLELDELMKLLGFKLNDTVKLFYVCKEYRKKDDIDKARGSNAIYKEIAIRAKKYEQKILNHWKDARYTIKSIKKKVIPPREVCNSISCSKAKSCPYVARCFNV